MAGLTDSPIMIALRTDRIDALPAPVERFRYDRGRVRAGIARARREGRPHGRPRTAALKADQVLRLKAERVSHAEIARRLGIGRTSVRRILAAG